MDDTKKLTTTIIIYLIGKSGTGKYTIAKEIVKNNDYVIADNQLINNPIFALLKIVEDSSIPDVAWEAVSKIRKVVFNFISQDQKNNYIFTNELLENQGDYKLYKMLERMTLKRTSTFFPVKLSISPNEHKKRITTPERALRYKSTILTDELISSPLIKINHPNLLEIEVSNLSASEVADLILDHIKSILTEENKI